MRRALRIFLLILAGCAGPPEEPLVLYDFESEEDLDRLAWRCRYRFELSDDWATSGERSLRCLLARERYPGVRFRDFETDWSGYDTLALDVRSVTKETVRFVVRVDDAAATDAFDDRYNGAFELPPGTSRIRIGLDEIREGPADRRLDPGRIGLFMVFVHNWNIPPEIYLDRIVLEP